MSLSYNSSNNIGIILSGKEYDAIFGYCSYQGNDTFIGNDNHEFRVIPITKGIFPVCKESNCSFVPFLLNGQMNAQNKEISIREEETWFFIPMKENSPLSVSYYFQDKKQSFDDIAAYFTKKVPMSLDEIKKRIGFVSFVWED